jgi:molybdopterin synthase catalytic subunit
MPTCLTDRPIDIASLLAECSGTGTGAAVVFVGTVRSSVEDGDVEGIEYTAYEAMAEEEFARIVAEAVRRWPEARVALRHRTGWVPLGEASVVIVAACPHRAAAYEASRFVIEETKKRAPVWKKERLAGGAARWVEPAGARVHG